MGENGYKVLIIDDEKELRQMLDRVLSIEGFECIQAPDANKGLELLKEQDFDCILCDVKLPDAYGVDLVKNFRKIRSSTEIIILTAFGKIHDGVNALKYGAFDYLLKGEDNDRIVQTVTNACVKSELSRKVLALNSKLHGGITFDHIIGSSKAIRDTIELAARVAPTDANVLITGATGTGKEVFARAIHSASLRAGKPFLALNCGSFTRELLESELFGYKAGSFTGAVRDKKGLIEEASGGTLFLDEIGEIPSDLQSKFLRVLETGDYFRIGETSPRRANFRLIAATNKDLELESGSGRFRSDLYYRLNSFRIDLPDLSSRKEDIIPLASFFVTQFSAKLGKNIAGMSEEFRKLLEFHNWKGNIRELRNIIERACIMEDESELTPASLPLDFTLLSHSGKNNELMSLAEAEKEHILRVIRSAEGNKPRAAEILGIGLSTLYSKLKEYNL